MGKGRGPWKGLSKSFENALLKALWNAPRHKIPTFRVPVLMRICSQEQLANEFPLHCKE